LFSVGIALLVWMYPMFAIALFGCAFNAEFERSQSAQAAAGAGSIRTRRHRAAVRASTERGFQIEGVSQRFLNLCHHFI